MTGGFEETLLERKLTHRRAAMGVSSPLGQLLALFDKSNTNQMSRMVLSAMSLYFPPRVT